MICLLILSWIPATVTCKSDGVGRHITELIFLPQIFINASPISLFFIPFGFLPLIHIPLLVFYMIIVVSYLRLLFFFFLKKIKNRNYSLMVKIDENILNELFLSLFFCF